VKVLLVEDDDRVSLALTDILRRHGITVRRAGTAVEAVDRMGDDIDLVILDLGLPDHDGLAVLTRLRRERDVPIVIATARGDLDARLHGLHLGADDYLVKPYEGLELLARIHAVHRRGRGGRAGVTATGPARGPSDGSAGATTSGTAAGTVTGTLGGTAGATTGGIAVDVGARTVHVDGRPVTLTRKEFDVLAVLAASPGVVFRREQLLSEIWASRWKGGGRTLEVHVASLRAKLGRPTAIETVRGIGYRFAGTTGTTGTPGSVGSAT